MDRAIAHLHKIKLVLHHLIFAQDKTSIISFHKTEVNAQTCNMIMTDRIFQGKLQHRNWPKVDYLTGIQLAQNPTFE